MCQPGRVTHLLLSGLSYLTRVDLTLGLASEGGVALSRPRSKEDGHCWLRMISATLLLLKQIRPAPLPHQTSPPTIYRAHSLVLSTSLFQHLSKCFLTTPLNTLDPFLVETVSHTSWVPMILTNDHHMFLLAKNYSRVYFVCMDGHSTVYVQKLENNFREPRESCSSSSYFFEIVDRCMGVLPGYIPVCACMCVYCAHGDQKGV